MNFFINENFNEKNSGIEHAQLKRALLFRKNKAPFKLVFQSWNPLLHHWLSENQIHDDEILNMFDYFQHAEEVKPKVVQAQDIDFGVDNLTYNEEPNHNRYIVFHDKAIVGRVNYFAKNISDQKQVSSVELFDGFGNLYRVDFYDLRGFKSMVQWYTPDNKIATEVWYSIDGKPVVESYYRKNALGKMQKSGWKTISDEGTVRTHSGMNELVLQFLNEVNDKYFSKKHPNIFIMDRSDTVEDILPLLRKPAYNVLHLHNSHAGNAQKPNTSIMNDNYEYSLINGDRYDAIISATHKQTHDVKYRFDPKCDLYTIPVGVIPDAKFKQKRIPMSDRDPYSIVATARIAPEKQFDQVIRAMGYAKKQVPKIHLDLYGYVDHSHHDTAMKRIKKAEKDTGLTDQVHIHGYTQDVADVQRKAQLYGLASVMEGFNLAMMEAQSEGDVGVTYDVNYGPNELVQNNQNGYVVKYGDEKALGAKMAYLFTHPKELQKMSDQAYELSNRYSEKNVWKDWKKLLDGADQKWAHKIKLYQPEITKGIEQMDEGV
ncbi:glycosyl transferase family 1 [Philodulcilactobacillus myokoensis]|uniref:Glycosyl transferase family 1 n=1 Tax=Philodulcilactobacillus myokoensis TaxID=2929573 RepID=A0A9W6B0J2_9LACO|nr:glycosyltransferase [Philodulcilactobacillus myokoensis]GLB46320.1 glycosyl transferase family 1 [Philodulcilactobacillus myokoensis]